MLGRAALFYVISALALNAAIASEDCPSQEAEIAELKLILKNDPAAFAIETSKKNQPYFLAVQGYATEVPGVSENDLQCVYKHVTVKRFPATSDVLCNDEIVALQPVARDFAAKYNSVLKQALSLQCP